MQIFNMQTIAQTIMSLEQSKPKKMRKSLKLILCLLVTKTQVSLLQQAN